MFDAKAMLYLYVETPLHAGSGTSLGVVDLPVQRERVTGYPMVQASSIKGKLRAEAYERVSRGLEFTHLRQQIRQQILTELQQKFTKGNKLPDEEDKKGMEKEADRWSHREAAKKFGLEIVFGPETTGASDHAGAFAPGDARLLLFPVRSLLGVFAWTTSKDALARFCRDAKAAYSSLDWEAIGPSNSDNALVATSNDIAAEGKIVLEEFAFPAQPSDQVNRVAEWLVSNTLPQGPEYQYWREKLPRSLVILPENAFRDFTQFATEVISRIRLDRQTKTVETGALWTEEHLPTDTLLYAPLLASKPRVGKSNLPEKWRGSADEVLNFVTQLEINRVQLGGDETVGRGIVSLRFYTGGK